MQNGQGRFFFLAAPLARSRAKDIADCNDRSEESPRCPSDFWKVDVSRSTQILRFHWYSAQSHLRVICLYQSAGQTDAVPLPMIARRLSVADRYGPVVIEIISSLFPLPIRLVSGSVYSHVGVRAERSARSVQSLVVRCEAFR